MILQLSNITKYFAGNIILDGINIEVKNRDRIAIVGKNGAGKSTLLKIMTKELDYDDGEIFEAKELSIGYLAQHHDLTSDATIVDEMMTVFAHLLLEELELMELARRIEEESSTGNHDERLVNEYSTRHEKFEEAGGYRFKSDIKGILNGLGFAEEDFHLQISDLSGGQKTRIALAKLLLNQPDLLILDEPTNHLDIPTLTWLENYLSNYKGALIIVSHDRYFLDKIVNVVYEISRHEASKYTGTYTAFLQQKQANYERNKKIFEKQQKEMKEMEEFVERNIARASTTKRAQSRRKQLEKMEVVSRPNLDNQQAKFSFQVAKTSGNDVLHTNEFSFTYPGEDVPLFQNVSFTIYRGERIALIGDNGVGKTTLLKEIIHDTVNFTHGANVQIGYYAQEQENLTETNTILAEVWDTFPDKAEQEIRTVLGNFLFSGEDVLKHIHTLSGGERARVALAKLMLQKANFLILDEPTNHLDLASKEVLENALQDYEGTIFFVSHDRYFINKIADKIFELEPEKLTVYLGNYDYFIEKKEQMAAIKELESPDVVVDKPENQSTLSYQEQKRLQSEQRKIARQIERVENDIEQCEAVLEAIEADMIKPKNLNDHEKLTRLAEEANTIKENIEELMIEWEELQS